MQNVRKSTILAVVLAFIVTSTVFSFGEHIALHKRKLASSASFGSVNVGTAGNRFVAPVTGATNGIDISGAGAMTVRTAGAITGGAGWGIIAQSTGGPVVVDVTGSVVVVVVVVVDVVVVVVVVGVVVVVVATGVATTDVAGDVASADPAPLVALTVTSRVSPSSVEATV